MRNGGPFFLRFVLKTFFCGNAHLLMVKKGKEVADSGRPDVRPACADPLRENPERAGQDYTKRLRLNGDQRETEQKPHRAYPFF